MTALKSVENDSMYKALRDMRVRDAASLKVDFSECPMALRYPRWDEADENFAAEAPNAFE